MNNNEEQLISKLRNTRLTDDERRLLRSRIHAYAKMNPARRAFIGLFVRHAFVSSFAIVLLLAGGTFALAHNAGPDSLLYPVRLAVNDKVAVAVSGDEDAQITKELAQLERMIADEQRLMDSEFADSMSEVSETDSISVELDSIAKDLDAIFDELPAEE